MTIPSATRPTARSCSASALIQGLKPADRQVVLLYLEDLDAAAIGEITGLSPGAIAVKIHRAKALLARRFNQGEGR
jgi:RNA polymerase sigma-70 factor (ECF subfamily)